MVKQSFVIQDPLSVGLALLSLGGWITENVDLSLSVLFPSSLWGKLQSVQQKNNILIKEILHF